MAAGVTGFMPQLFTPAAQGIEFFQTGTIYNRD
jgi:hypothetical protein